MLSFECIKNEKSVYFLLTCADRIFYASFSGRIFYCSLWQSSRHRSELDYLIYNDPLAYADLILNSKLNVLFE